MKLTTIQDITFTEWIAQVAKFTEGNDVLITRNIPQNTDTSGKAEIVIDFKRPLLNGIDAEVSYIQNYTTLIPVEGQEDVINNERIVVLKYKLQMDYATTNALLSQVDALIDASVIGLDRFKEQVKLAVLAYVESNQTVGGLPSLASDYTVEF